MKMRTMIVIWDYDSTLWEESLGRVKIYLIFDAIENEYSKK
jgi:hypothetical protein